MRLGGLAATQYLLARRDGCDQYLTHVVSRRATGPFPADGPAPEHWPPHGRARLPLLSRVLPPSLGHAPAHSGLRRSDDVGSATVTPRTVYDNVQRVITQAVTSIDGQPSLVLPREAPRSIAEIHGAFDQIRQLGFTLTDLSTFLGRIMRYLVTSPERRANELEDVSAYEFFVGADPDTGRQRYQYSAAFEAADPRHAEDPRRVRLPLRRRSDQHQHLRPAQHGARPLRQQGRRCAQRADDRSMVRPLVPPPQEARRRLPAEDALVLHGRRPT